MDESILKQNEDPAIVVFTDLDGSLLDHDTYLFKNARPALERIRAERIPLVFASSKTRPEIERLQASMGIREPFIVENGAAVYFPDGYRQWEICEGIRQPPYRVIRLGATYRDIRRFVQAVRPRFNLQGFGDLSAEDIAHLSGLPPVQAGLARQREFTEPFITADDSRIPELSALAEASGLTITRGGRFHHLMGASQDKGAAVRCVAAVILRNMGPPLRTIGLGDSANDRAMLQSVDLPILIPRPDGSYEDVEVAGLRKPPHPGSRGWNDMVLETLEALFGTESSDPFGSRR
jgi:mannosyl-3-phosphoglycerate phosphatase